MEPQRRSSRGAASRPGFLLALEWLKGNVDLGDLARAESSAEAREQSSRKRKTQGRPRTSREAPSRQAPETDPGEAAAAQVKEARHITRTRDRGRSKVVCDFCGRELASAAELKEHVAECKPLPPSWEDEDRVRCSVCKTDHDDGDEMIECERCRVWEHTKCHGINSPPVHWMCGGCRRALADLETRPSSNADPEDLSICDVCEQGYDAEYLFLCDGCNRGWHTYCMRSTMEFPPPANEDWFCSSSCQDNTKNFEQLLLDSIADENTKLALEAARQCAKVRQSTLDLLVSAFGSRDGRRGGMDVEYLEASLDSRKFGHWDNSLHRTVVMHGRGDVLSLCTFRVLGDNAAIEVIFAATAQSRQKGGVFRRLHDMVLRAAISHGVRSCVIHATPSSEAHFRKYSAKPMYGPRGGTEVRLVYVPVRRVDPEHRRLIPRLLEMGSRMLTAPLPELERDATVRDGAPPLETTVEASCAVF